MATPKVTQPKMITVILVINDALLSRIIGKEGRIRSSSITSETACKLLDRILHYKVKNGNVIVQASNALS